MFGENIRELRELKGYTQQDLANKLNVSRSKVAMWETNKRDPGTDDLRELADIFDVTIDYLLGKSTDPKLSRKDELDIAKEIDKINESLENTNELMFHGEILDEETRELLKKSLENTIYFSKILAKEKFNPNKNKKNNDSND